MFRTITNSSHTADNWSPIGTTINIADGAITLPKLNSAVYSAEAVDAYINEGNSSATYKATGICQKIAGLCTLVVKARCTSSNTMNSFTLPNQFHANTDYAFYTDVSIWPTAQVPAKEYSIKISGDTCYIRTKDGSSLGGATVYFSITYIPGVS